MAVPMMLTEPMLERLFEGWRHAGAPIVQSLRPGLDEREIDATTSELRLRLPVEARTWWAWHDGASSTMTSHALGLGFLYLPLSKAVALYRQWRAIAHESVDPASLDPERDADDIWHPSWFPISKGGDGTTVACDCSVDEGAPSPIRSVHWSKRVGRSAVPVADSLGTVVSWWIEALEDGTWTYDHKRQGWNSNSAQFVDVDREATGLL